MAEGRHHPGNTRLGRAARPHLAADPTHRTIRT
jgi:hypothetical protein